MINTQTQIIPTNYALFMSKCQVYGCQRLAYKYKVILNIIL